jgi:LiaI-LiaF-like transmembrane region
MWGTGGVKPFDWTSLAGGLVLIGLGSLLLFDRVDAIDLRFGYLWPALLAAVGAVLLASGLSRRDRT